MRQRLALEAAAFGGLNPTAAKSLSVFWHNAHVPHLALTARVDCPASFNVCVNVCEPAELLPAITTLLWCSGLVVVRDMDDTFLRRSICSVPIPTDFAGFEEDDDFRGHEPPPILVGGSGFEFTSTMAQTPRGPAVLAMGMVPIHERLFAWLHGAGQGIYQCGRVFVGSFLPPTFVEAVFLDSGLFFHRSTGLLPTFIGSVPWVPDDPVTQMIRVAYLDGCSILELVTTAEAHYADIDGRARSLRALVDRAERTHATRGTGEDAQWENERSEWERAQRRFVEEMAQEISDLGVSGGTVSVRTATLTLYVCSTVPSSGSWRRSVPELERELPAFAATPRSHDLRRSPCSFVAVDL